MLPTPHFLSIDMPAPLDVIYSDESLLAVNKPAGQLFHGYTKGLPLPLVDQLKQYVQEQSGKASSAYLGVVHRLDRPVSGISIFGRNSKFTGRLSQQFQERRLDKVYLACVEGRPEPTSAQLDDLLQAPPSSDRPDKGPQLCQLWYKCIQTLPQGSLLAIRLGTGRRHQIRMQLSQRGWPVVGDREYGAKSFIPGTADLDARFRPIALHAAELRLSHPKTQQALTLSAPLPWYWQGLGIDAGFEFNYQEYV